MTDLTKQIEPLLACPFCGESGSRYRTSRDGGKAARLRTLQARVEPTDENVRSASEQIAYYLQCHVKDDVLVRDFRASCDASARAILTAIKEQRHD